MPLILPSQRIIRPNPLAYPAGAVPGIHRSHPASSGGILLSAVPSTSNFINLLNGQPGTSTGTISGSMFGNMGPTSFQSSGSSTGQVTFAGSIGGNAATFAAFAVYQNNSGNSDYVFDDGASVQNGLAWGLADSTTWNFSTGLFHATTVTVASTTNVPIFFAVSYTSAAAYWLIKRLDNGVTFTGSVSGSVVAPGDGTFYLGNRPSGPRPWMGHIGPVMVSNAMMSPQQLLAWSADPWSFWYPNKTINLASAAASAGASFLPVWAYRYNLPVLGTGNF